MAPLDGFTQTDDLWRLTWEHSPVGMALVGVGGQLLMVNRAMSDMLGYPEEELSRRGFQEITHPDDLDADLALFGQALAGEIDSYRMRKRYLHADGRIVWGDLSVALVRQPDGEPMHFISQILDVTEQHENTARIEAATAEVDRERQTLEAIFETVGVGLLLIGPDGRYERSNRRHQETIVLPFPQGHQGSAGQLGHVYHLDGKTPMTREEMPSYRATQGEEFDDYTYWVGADPASRAAFSTSARQVRGPNGERLGAVLAYQEITDLMRAIQVKDQFVASVSHELRTPLTTVLGYLELLGEREDLPEDLIGQIRVVQRNALRLRELLSDLLLIGQVADGALELQPTTVDLSAIVRDAVEAARISAGRAGIELSADVPGRLVGVADPQRLRQVLDNLLTNAIKYSRTGDSVAVALRTDGNEVHFEVTDTGMGIPADEIDLVFGRFFRGGEALEQQVQGTGLGLNIVSTIVAAHNGRVDVESELGKGSTFRVVLPGAAH